MIGLLIRRKLEDTGNSRLLVQEYHMFSFVVGERPSFHHLTGILDRWVQYLPSSRSLNGFMSCCLGFYNHESG